MRYLWVDALCIMQPEDGDDGAGLADWREQAPEMGRIYAHAACVLSATAAKNTTDGCILTKMPLGGSCHLREDGVTSLDVNLARAKDTIVTDLFREKVDKARLSTRGWAFRERVLATRILHFCDGVVLFECSEMQASSSHHISQPYPQRQWLQNRVGILSRASAMLDPVAKTIFVPMPKWQRPGDYLWDLYRETAGLLGTIKDTRKGYVTFDPRDNLEWSLGTSQPKTRAETRAGLRAAFITLVQSEDYEFDSSLLFHHCWF